MIIAALMLPAAVGVAALAVEGGLWYADHHQMRNMADAAALAAGWARREGTDQFSAAMNAVGPVGYDAGTDEIELISPPADGPYAGDAQAIQIVAHRARPLVMSTLFLPQSAVDISATAVVRLQTLGSYCVLALDPSSPAALNLVGTTNLNLVNCGVSANSNAANALTMVGNTQLKTAWVEITGGISLSGGATIDSTEAPETGDIPRPDPYANLAMPGSGSCNYNSYSAQANTTVTMSPGRYCGGVTINAKAKVTMSPGTYYIDGSSLTVNGNATVSGTGVTIVLTGSGSNWATATINGGAKMALTAPKTGAYAGLAFVQDRNAPSGGLSKLNGGSTMSISGAMYFPTQAIEFAGGNSTGMGCTRLIAQTVKFSGNATLGDNCAGMGLPEGLPDNPQLVD